MPPMDTASLTRDGLSRIGSAADSTELEEVRVALVGRRAPLTQALRELGTLPAEERGPRGKVLNVARRTLEAALEQRERELRDHELDERLRRDRIDVTLPGHPVPRGSTHLIEQTAREILDILIGLGYAIVDGPEVETVHHTFDALNTPVTHPSRQWTDTFYVSEDLVLRTHTSPMQIRTMEAGPPPVYMATAGRCYRRDTPDATHTPMFTQIEGLAVDRGLSLAHLKGTLLAFSREMFGPDREVRLRPHFFPFTEPSVEVDVSCFACARDGSHCRVCRGEGWVEILGAGMVDPALFSFVQGYDPEELTGYAWGMGVERIAALRHDIPDIRMLWENDLRFMEQFG
jgi:phenylalanyl-tRNA synthetase alpha chain